MNLIIAANWKMHKTAAETAAFCRRIRRNEDQISGVDLLICPPFTALSAAAGALRGSKIALGAQNMHWEDHGAYTGEVSAAMLLEFEASHVIIGHSERRHLFGEDDHFAAQKVRAALQSGLKPILCVGETDAERRQDQTEAVLQRQLQAVLEGLPATAAAALVIAYEPVWAIGTGMAASAADAGAAARLIASEAARYFGSEAAALRVQYGGSVNASNIGAFVSLPGVHGALVGGASLQEDTFLALVTAAREAAGR